MRSVDSHFHSACSISQPIALLPAAVLLVLVQLHRRTGSRPCLSGRGTKPAAAAAATAAAAAAAAAVVAASYSLQRVDLQHGTLQAAYVVLAAAVLVRGHGTEALISTDDAILALSYQTLWCGQIAVRGSASWQANPGLATWMI